MAAPVFEKLTSPLKDALAKAGLTVDQIDSVELIGGTTRIPKVKETLAEFFGGKIDGPNKLATTLNQDEAVARGCAFQCAMLSPVFRVREFNVQDINNHPIEITWDASQLPDAKKGEKHVTQMEAFGANSPLPSGKKLTFSRLLRSKEMGKAGVTTFKAKASYSADAVLPTGTIPEIGEFTIGGIKKYPSCDVKDGDKVLYSKATIQVAARLDGNGLVTLDSAYQIEDDIVPVEEQKDDNAPDAELVENKQKTKKVTRKHQLTVTATTAGASTTVLNAWLAAEGDMAANDRLVVDTAEKRNELEEYVYETRSKLSDQWSDFMVEAERETFVAKLNEMEDWLYGEGEDAQKSTYVEQLVTLRKVGDPVHTRYIQSEERPIAEREYRDYVNSALLDIKREDGKYDHIEKPEMTKTVDLLNQKLEWLNTKMTEQHALPKHAPVAITSDQVHSELINLKIAVNTVINKPKPKPVPKEEKKEEKKEEEKTEKDSMEEDQPPLEEVEDEKKMELD
jgi:heat shock protein 4